ncbi:hypothetical protein HNR16_001279 [Pseudoclavibacter chungangensis]|nr:hypothetical protein [Pseudoclavibacter chungangensis]
MVGVRLTPTIRIADALDNARIPAPNSVPGAVRVGADRGALPDSGARRRLDQRAAPDQLQFLCGDVLPTPALKTLSGSSSL